MSSVHQKQILHALETFTKNPFTKSLNNHALHGKLASFRSISAGYDIRIIFEEYDGYTIVIFIKVGTHDQVY